MPQTEVQRLKRSLNFLISHLPGVSEVVEAIDAENVTLDDDELHAENPEEVLVGKKFTGTAIARHQKALNEFRERRHSNLEIGRFYERYIGYLYEIDGWHVTYKGIIDGFGDLGRDLICVKGDVHHIVQAKCWSKKKEIQVKDIYQLDSTTKHYAMSFRKALRESGKSRGAVMINTHATRFATPAIR